LTPPLDFTRADERGAPKAKLPDLPLPPFDEDTLSGLRITPTAPLRVSIPSEFVDANCRLYALVNVRDKDRVKDKYFTVLALSSAERIGEVPLFCFDSDSVSSARYKGPVKDYLSTDNHAPKKNSAICFKLPCPLISFL
jgi:hypothetical protein